MGITTIKSRSVSNRHLISEPKKTSGANVSVQVTNYVDTQDIIVEAGENLTAGNVATIYTDGKAYHASALYSDAKPAMYFIVNSVSTGEDVFLRRYKLIEASISGTAGDWVYLRDGATNISITALTTKSVNEDLQQIVGRFTEDDNFIQPLFMKAGQLL